MWRGLAPNNYPHFASSFRNYKINANIDIKGNHLLNMDDGGSSPDGQTADAPAGWLRYDAAEGTTYRVPYYTN